MHQWFSSMCNLTPGDSDGEQAEDESVEAREEPHLWRVQQHVPVFCEHIFQNILCDRLRIIMSYIWTSQVNPQGTDIFFEVGNLFRISLTNSTVVFHLYWERKIFFYFCTPGICFCLFVRLMWQILFYVCMRFIFFRSGIRIRCLGTIWWPRYIFMESLSYSSLASSQSWS